MSIVPLAPYSGKKPFIFISYSHKDVEIVYPIIRNLQEKGFRCWYDSGIEVGTEWPAYIAERINACNVILAFVSRNWQDSKHCKREFFYADENNKKNINIILEDFALEPELKLAMNLYQKLFYYLHTDENSFIKALVSASVLSDCRGSQETLESANKYNSDGMAYIEKGDFISAKNCFENAVEILENLAKRTPRIYDLSLAFCLNSLGMTYRNLKENGKAEQALLTAITILENFKSKYGNLSDDYLMFLAICYNNLSGFYQEDGEDVKKVKDGLLKAYDILIVLTQNAPGKYDSVLNMVNAKLQKLP